MGNMLCSKSIENIKIISQECISLKDSIILLQKQLEERNKQFDELKTQHKSLIKDNKYLKQDNKLKQRSNFNLLSKIHEYEKLKQNIENLLKIDEGVIMDTIIDSSNKGDNDWFYNLLYEKNNYRKVIKYYNNKLYDLIEQNDSEKSD
tara:strand:+ start:579 stop:1022 length:444 start_codon:yes stop_codon:yes gene_type:complete